MEVPFYIAEFDETNPEHGLFKMSVVKTPAMFSKYVAFDKSEPVNFAVNAERQIIAGPAVIPDVPIERVDENKGRYYMIIPRPVITKVIEYYALNQRQNNVNLMHLPNSDMKNVAMVENFQIDRTRGIMPPIGFEHLIDGAWWVGYKFFDKAQFENMKKNYRGFSIEGFLGFTYGGTIEKDEADEMLHELTQIEQFFK